MTPEEEEQEGKRLYRHVAAARAYCLEIEKENLRSIHTALFEQCQAIRQRLEMIERNIRADKSSVA